MKFFSKIVFICNLLFLVGVILRSVEAMQRTEGNFDGVIPFQPVEGMITILGLLFAIILNSLFIFFIIYRFLAKKINRLPNWIVWANVIIYPAQIYFHFFYHPYK